MRTLSSALLNGTLSCAISVTMVLTVAEESDEAWDKADLMAVAGISGFLSGACASYFGGTLRRRTRRNAL